MLTVNPLKLIINFPLASVQFNLAFLSSFTGFSLQTLQQHATCEVLQSRSCVEENCYIRL